MLRDLIIDKLELAGETVFDRVPRLSSKPNSPVTVPFLRTSSKF